MKRFVVGNGLVKPPLRNQAIDFVGATARNAAAEMIGVTRTEFNEIVRSGLIVPLCRIGGPTADNDRFRLSDIKSLLPDALEYVEPSDSRFVSFRALMQDTGLSPAAMLQKIAADDLQPSARRLNSPHLNEYFFDRDEMAHLTRAKTISRRILRDRPGVTCVDAAARFGVTLDIIQALVACGLLRLIAPSVSGTTRPRVELESLEELCRLYAPPAAYADILCCSSRHAVRKLRAFGVPIITIPFRDGRGAYIVLRSAVAKTIPWAARPVDDYESEWARFWRALGKYFDGQQISL